MKAKHIHSFWILGIIEKIVLINILLVTACNAQINLSNRIFTDSASFIRSLSYESSIEISYNHDSTKIELIKFHKPVNFKNSEFTFKFDFPNLIFDSSVDFENVIFLDSCSFKKSTFDSTVNFCNVIFKSYCDFSDAEFHFFADFYLTKFERDANFQKALFFKVSFAKAMFNNVDFQNSKFKTDDRKCKAWFKDASFNGKCNFTFAILPDTLDFRYVIEIDKEIDFTYCKLFNNNYENNESTKSSILLTGSNLNQIKLNCYFFNLSFPDETTLEEVTSVYEGVLKKCKDIGYLESYKYFDLEYKYILSSSNIFTEIIHFLQVIWWNYGYEKVRIFPWAACFIIIFWIINSIFFRKLNSQIYSFDFIESLFVDSNLSNGFLFIIKYLTGSIIYTFIIFFGLTMSLEKFSSKNFNNNFLFYILIFFEYVVGLVCTGFIVNLIFTR